MLALFTIGALFLVVCGLTSERGVLRKITPAYPQEQEADGD